nr:hypothetical protein [Streptomyces sp. WAC04770]
MPDGAEFGTGIPDEEAERLTTARSIVDHVNARQSWTPRFSAAERES